MTKTKPDAQQMELVMKWDIDEQPFAETGMQPKKGWKINSGQDYIR